MTFRYSSSTSLERNPKQLHVCAHHIYLVLIISLNMSVLDVLYEQVTFHKHMHTVHMYKLPEKKHFFSYLQPSVLQETVSWVNTSGVWFQDNIWQPFNLHICTLIWLIMDYFLRILGIKIHVEGSTQAEDEIWANFQYCHTLSIKPGHWKKFQNLHKCPIFNPEGQNWADCQSTGSGFWDTGEFSQFPYSGTCMWYLVFE